MKDLSISFITLWRLNDWGKYNRRDEAILWELSRRNNVSSALHVEHVSIKGLIYKFIEWLREKDKNMKKVYLYHILKGISFKPISVDRNKKYYIYSIVIGYFGNNKFLKRISNFFTKIQYGAINRYFVQHNRYTVLIAYPPSQYLPYAIKAIKHDLLIADFEDDTAERAKNDEEKNKVLQSYKEILPKCKWIFSTSPSITQKYRDLAGQEITFLPNGVDVHNFQANSHKKPFKKNNRIVIGYIGVLNREIDIDLLEYMLDHYPHIDFIMIGSATNECLIEIIKLTKKYSNLHYLGERNYIDIPSYTSYFDILINIKKNDYTTAGGESQKIYEYLLTGKPIVSTPVSPADRFAGLIYVATDKYQFTESLKKALEEDNSDLREKRIKAAIDNSWTKRVNVILEKVTKLLCVQCNYTQDPNHDLGK